MCGIAGARGPRERIDETLSEVRRITGQLNRRGPDGTGFGAWGGVALGHARLAIIDLRTGDQPQSDQSGRVVVVVNGEIYNYVELRRELEDRGHVFRTNSDVEVIPHLYRIHGESFVDHLRGMFAIALYDLDKDVLYLVRDRLGKKPIYYLSRNGCLYFASEIKGLLQLPDLSLTVDPRAVEDYFTFQYVPAPRSVFEEIRKVPAASFLRVTSRAIETVEYWCPSLETDHSMTENAALERLEAVFDEAVKMRLRSDVPLGAFLSGGIDSNLVMATATSMVDAPLATTTIDFGGANQQEVERARSVSRRFETRHTTKSVAADPRELLLKVAGYLDEPLGDSSTLPTWLVSKATREDVTVAISGDGGDETFGGYAWRYYQNLLLERVRRRMPSFLRPVVAAVARGYPKADRLPKPLRLKWGLRNLSATAEEAYFLDMSILRPEDKEALYRPELRRAIGDYRSSDVLATHFERARDRDLLGRLMWVDLKTYLAEGVLAKVDRMSMAHSLEVRSPLLDHKVVELALRIPSRLKLKGKVGKYLLRRLAERRVGSDVARAPKQGFAPPITDWLRDDLAELFRDVVVEHPKGIHLILDGDAVARMFAEHLAGRRDHARPLWLFLTFELWFRNFGSSARLL